jgi:hypothetical protein
LFALIIFLIDLTVFAQMDLDHDPPNYTSKIVGIIGMKHHALPFPWFLNVTQTCHASWKYAFLLITSLLSMPVFLLNSFATFCAAAGKPDVTLAVAFLRMESLPDQNKTKQKQFPTPPPKSTFFYYLLSKKND